MFRLLQLIKNTVFAAIFLSAAHCVPLAGSVFADEWGIDAVASDKGRIKKIVEVFKQGDVEHHFDGNGRKILRTFPDKQSGKKVEYKMRYDSAGRLVQVDCLLDGKLVFSEKGTYGDGLLRSIVRYDADNKELFGTTMLGYDEKSGLLKMYGVQNEKGIADYHFTRNKAGKIVYVRCMIKNNFASGARYSYDGNGFVSEVRRFNERMQNIGILKNSWKLDSKGNWIEKKSSLFANLAQRAVFSEIISRKIEYRE